MNDMLFNSSTRNGIPRSWNQVFSLGALGAVGQIERRSLRWDSVERQEPIFDVVLIGGKVIGCSRDRVEVEHYEQKLELVTGFRNELISAWGKYLESKS